MLKQNTSKRFDKEFTKQIQRGKDVEKLIQVMDLILEEQPLPPKYKDHSLKGNWQGYRECHIEGDWLLIYKVEKGTVFFAHTGTHSDLFG